MAVSGNYVDASNWVGSMEELASTETRSDDADGINEARHLLWHWRQTHFDSAMDMAPEDLLYKHTFRVN